MATVLQNTAVKSQRTAVDDTMFVILSTVYATLGFAIACVNNCELCVGGNVDKVTINSSFILYLNLRTLTIEAMTIQVESHLEGVSAIAYLQRLFTVVNIIIKLQRRHHSSSLSLCSHISRLRRSFSSAKTTIIGFILTYNYTGNNLSKRSRYSYIACRHGEGIDIVRRRDFVVAAVVVFHCTDAVTLGRGDGQSDFCALLAVVHAADGEVGGGSCAVVEGQLIDAGDVGQGGIAVILANGSILGCVTVVIAVGDGGFIIYLADDGTDVIRATACATNGESWADDVAVIDGVGTTDFVAHTDKSTEADLIAAGIDCTDGRADEDDVSDGCVLNHAKEADGAVIITDGKVADGEVTAVVGAFEGFTTTN